jgi:hypothetical protein
MTCGEYFLNLKELTAFMHNSSNNMGQIVQSFGLAIEQFLTFYQNQVLCLAQHVKERREKEGQILDSRGSLRTPPTLIELKVHMEPLMN